MNTNNNVIGVGCDALLSSWLPIETAPKDKIEVLAWSKQHGINVGTLTHYKKPEMPSRKGAGFSRLTGCHFLLRRTSSSPVGKITPNDSTKMKNEIEAGQPCKMLKMRELNCAPTMKVYITKYALTSGIIEDNNAKATNYAGMIELSSPGQYMHGADWHTTRKAAALKAETMRVKKIAALRKQLSKLEKFTF